MFTPPPGPRAIDTPFSSRFNLPLAKVRPPPYVLGRLPPLPASSVFPEFPMPFPSPSPMSRSLGCFRYSPPPRLWDFKARLFSRHGSSYESSPPLRNGPLVAHPFFFSFPGTLLGCLPARRRFFPFRERFYGFFFSESSLLSRCCYSPISWEMRSVLVSPFLNF